MQRHLSLTLLALVFLFGTSFAVTNISACQVINAPGQYQLNANIFGAPNDISEWSPGADVCLKIGTSNVFLDCQGWSLVEGGLGGTTVGIAVNNTQRNVTVQNCNTFHYDIGILSYFAEDNFFFGNRAFHGARGFLFSRTTNTTVAWNIASNQSYAGYHVLTYSDRNRFGFNLANATRSGFYVESYSDNNTFFMGAAVYSPQGAIGPQGIYVRSNCNDNNFTNFFLCNMSSGVEVMFTSYRNNFVNLSICNMSNRAIYLSNARDTSITNAWMFNNRMGLDVDGGMGAFNYTATDLIFLNSLGLLGDHGNISIVDNVELDTRYWVNWTTQPAPLPGTVSSFANKYLWISSWRLGWGWGYGPSYIDQITWHWIPGEEPGYTPANFHLVQYNTTYGWQLINETPNTGARTLTAYNLYTGNASGHGFYTILDYIADLSVVKTDQTPLAPSPGGIVEFNMTVQNTGNVTFDTLSIVEMPELGFSLLNWTVVGQPFPLPPGASFRMYINFSVDSGVVDAGTPIRNLTNFITITGASNLSSNVSAWDYENATIYWQNVSVVKNASDYSPSVGEIVTFTLNITNEGESDLALWVTDPLPFEIQYAGSAIPLPDSVANGTLRWSASLPVLAPGQSTLIRYNVTVNLGGATQNTVTVFGIPPNGFNISDTSSVNLAATYVDTDGKEPDPPECEVDSDCLNECYYCSIAQEECMLKPGFQCGEDSDCIYAGYTCEMCVCAPPECLEDSDCPAGFTCEDMECEPPECLRDEDCDEDEECDDYECVEKELPECESNADCGATQYCFFGNCFEVECECGEILNHSCVGFECCTDADCESGFACNGELHECEEIIIEEPEEPEPEPMEEVREEEPLVEAQPAEEPDDFWVVAASGAWLIGFIVVVGAIAYALLMRGRAKKRRPRE